MGFFCLFCFSKGNVQFSFPSHHLIKTTLFKNTERQRRTRDSRLWTHVYEHVPLVLLDAGILQWRAVLQQV